MKTITDEILQKYLDNELNDDELALFNITMNQNPEVIKDLRAYKTLESKLRDIEYYSAPENITAKIMKAITNERGRVNKKDPFFYWVSGGVSGLIIAIITFLIFLPQKQNRTFFPEYEFPKPMWSFFETLLQHFYSIFGNQNILIVGIVLSFVMILSTYFIADSHKKFIENLKS